MQEDEILFQKRIVELSRKSSRQNQYTFTGFLTLAQQELFFQSQSLLEHTGYMLFGGMEGCERQMLRFGSEAFLGYEQPFPIVCIKIEPRMPKYAQELSHRDFLGALMHLGIERNILGDIIIKNNAAYVFANEVMKEFIIENIDQIRHTPVKCTEITELPAEITPHFKEEVLIISSLRLDGIISKLYHLSRSQSLILFREKKVFVNGRQMENNSGICKEGDIISVRGYGKFIYDGLIQETRKGNLSIRVKKYI